MKSFIVALVVLLACLQAKPIYDSKKSYVTPLNSLNFRAQVLKIRETTSLVSVVQYYKSGDGFSQNFAKEFDDWTNEYRGLFRIGAVDCDEQAAICETEKITTFPTFRIYPPTPMPYTDLTGEDIQTKKIMTKASKELKSNVIEINSNNINTFINESPSVPKAFLFTKQEKGTPMIFKGLSVSFEKKIFFGIIRSNDEILVDRYKIKKFPSIIVVKANEKRPIPYKGQDFKFNTIFEFLNIYSQAFVPGGGSSSDSSASKSWLQEIVPEMHNKSANDICLKIEGGLCVIYIGKGKPEKETINMLKDLNVAYDKKIQRGSVFKFMWLDSSVETDYAKAFKYDDKDIVVVLNAGKRKRYVLHEGDITFNALKSTLEKISGGDARFVRVDLPMFTVRKD